MPAIPIQKGLFTPEGDPHGPCLIAGRCVECDALHFPATPICPFCSASACEEHRVGADGTLFVGTVVRTAPPGYRGPTPYGFGLVDLEGGLRVVSVLDETDPARLQKGLALRLEIRPLYQNEDGDPVLSWIYAPTGEDR
ncbi:MAG: OB-fold domain-containing protein [bacterium]